jgi:ABC-type antimicrobial peptide transport system permease subunit
MLGIIIGVAAVLTMVALGTGARASVEGEVSSAGTNIIFVRSGNYTRGGDAVGIVSGKGAATTLVAGDADAIVAGVSGIKALSPGVSLRTFISSGDDRSFSRVQGIAANFATIYSWNMNSGRMLDPAAPQPEAIVGSTLAATMFGADADPVGKTIQVRDVSYTIVGVTDGQAEDHAEVLFVPWQVLQRSMGQSHLETLTIAADKAGESSRIASEVSTILRKRHGIEGTPSEGYLAGQGGIGGTPDDFTVETQAAQALTQGLYTPAAAFALATLAIFLLFTPMHDAAHGSVATASSGWVRVSRVHNYRQLPNVTFSSELYGRFSH